MSGAPFEELMEIALREAAIAGAAGEVPIGALVVNNDGSVLSSTHNRREELADPTAHAEILALREAATKLGSWRLQGCTLVVTLEPCAMCAGAAVNSRLQRIVYGAPDPKAGACWSLYNIPQDRRLNHRIELVAGVLEERCATVLSEFFAAHR